MTLNLVITNYKDFAMRLRNVMHFILDTVSSSRKNAITSNSFQNVLSKDCPTATVAAVSLVDQVNILFNTISL